MKIWEGFDWSAVAVEDGSGCDDAAFLGLEELDGSTYAAYSRGEEPPPKKKKKKKTTEGEMKEEDQAAPEPEKKKKKKKKKKKEKKTTVVEEEVKQEEEEGDNEEQRTLASAWCPVEKWSGQELDGRLLDGLRRKGFQKPTPVQSAVLPVAVVKGRDVACAAETGSGKTLAYMLPALQHIMNDLYSPQPLSTIVVAPTRELAVQAAKHGRAMLPDGTDARQESVIACIVGGLSDLKQRRILDKKPPIIVATPGRFWDLLSSKLPHVMAAFQEGSALRYFIVDEADKLLEDGFPDLKNIANQLVSDNSKGRWQTMVFSATLALDADKGPADLPSFAEPLRAPTRKRKLDVIDLTTVEEAEVKLPETLRLEHIKVSTPAGKLGALLAFLTKGEKKRVLVFVNAVRSVKRVCHALGLLKVEARSLYAGMSQRSRLRALEKLTKGPCVLVATDVAARGLDIPDLDAVFHYDIARDLRTFVHRAGRTARAGRSGLSLSVVAPMDASNHRSITDLLFFHKADLDLTVLDAASRRAAAALDIAQADDLSSKELADTQWLRNISRTDDDEDDLLDEAEPEEKHDATSQRALKQKKAHLAQLLAVPLVTRPKRSFIVVNDSTLASVSSPQQQQQQQITKKKRRRR